MEKSTPHVFTPPRHDASGFASIPGWILDQFARGKYEKILLFLVDGLGWVNLNEFLTRPFLRRAMTEGRLEKITAQFPSTTAAQITTLHTGRTVGEHSIVEWYYYEPSLDAVIAPLLFSFSGTLERETLKSVGATARGILPKETIYNRLSNLGVKSTIFQPREYTNTTYSNFMLRGGETRGYRTLAEGLINLAEAMEGASSPAYFHFYFDRIDAMGHSYGPNAPQTNAEILSFLLLMENLFLEQTPRLSKTLLLLTSDHGSIGIDPQTTIYLNLEPRFEGLEKFIRRDRAGRLIIPAGSCRDFILYTRDGMIDEAQEFLARRLGGRAEVWKTCDLIDEGWFGPSVSERFRAHAGDLIILPLPGESVWWYEKDRFFQRYYGQHGGLSAEEMEIPLLTWEM